MAIDFNSLDPEVTDYIRTLRSEAAENRVKATEWQGKAAAAEQANAPLTAKVTKLEGDLAAAAKSTGEANKVAWSAKAKDTHKLTDAQVAFVQGDTEAAYLAHAAEVAKVLAPAVVKPPVNQDLGRTPATVADGSGLTAEDREFGDKLMALRGLSAGES